MCLLDHRSGLGKLQGLALRLLKERKEEVQHEVEDLGSSHFDLYSSFLQRW